MMDCIIEEIDEEGKMNLRNKEEMMINPNVGAVWPPLMLGLREQLRAYIWFASIYNTNFKPFFLIIF